MLARHNASSRLQSSQHEEARAVEHRKPPENALRRENRLLDCTCYTGVCRCVFWRSLHYISAYMSQPYMSMYLQQGDGIRGSG